MVGAAETYAPVVGKEINGKATASVPPSHVNTYRIHAVMDRMAQRLREGSKIDCSEFCNLCLSLARGIDFAVSNHEIPSRAKELPMLLKQLCQTRNDPVLEAAVMVVMVSIKIACGNKWFSDEDSEELCNISNEIAMRFCTSMDFVTAPNNALPIISTIMSRFYPRLKMGQILVFLEVKPGFGAYVKDFHISKQMNYSPDERVKLFVVQTDNVETSACLISPPQVNFLLNGVGVERRTNVFVDSGPQMPTSITSILKYGSNLLQAVGDFNGNYIIAVALMSEVSMTGKLTLEDYVQPAAAIVDPDSEIIEGPSRISLNCPISFKRIKTPVKGQFCKHLQCFDFDNYIGINSKRPSWRCPHCNHHVSFTEIRLDQNMVKVLKDVGENVNDVIISSDGSWKAVMESDDSNEKHEENFPIPEKDKSEQPVSSNFPSSGPLNLLDLTEVDDEMDVVGTLEVEERKVFPQNSRAQSSAENRSIFNPTEDNFWSGIYLSTFESGASSAIFDGTNVGNRAPTSTGLYPVLTDAISPAPNPEAGALSENVLIATSGSQSEISSPTALQIHQFQSGNTASSYEYGRPLTTPRHVNTRTAIAVQALPVQATSTLPQRPRSSMNILTQTPHLAAPGPLYPIRPSQHIVSPQASSQLRGAYIVPPTHQNSSQQHLRTPHNVNQSPGMFQSAGQSPGTFLRSQGNQGGSQGVSRPSVVSLNSHHYRMIAGQQAAQVPNTFQTPRLSASVPGNANGVGSMSQSAPSPDALGNSPADQNWRPTGRMRGSLSGRAYSEALNQFIIQPTQQAQAARPPSNVASVPTNPSSQLQILMANRAALQAANYPSTGFAATSSSNTMGVLPPQ